jgi:hypothetical protein
MRITAIISAIWINQPRALKKMKPSSHKTKMTAAIIKMILIATSPILIFSVSYDLPIMLA